MKALIKTSLIELRPEKGESEIEFMSGVDIDEELNEFLELRSVSFERCYGLRPHVKAYETPFRCRFHEGFSRVLVLHNTVSGKRVAVQQFVNYATDSFSLFQIPVESISLEG